MRLEVRDDLGRNRLTVFFRILLAIPHYIWLFLWSIAAVLAAIANWFATLVRGEPPRALHRFLTAYVRYAAHVNAYLLLAANPYPGFTGDPGTYPVAVVLPAEPQPQPRWKTFFRIILVLPAALVSAFLGGTLTISSNSSNFYVSGRNRRYGGGSPVSSGALAIVCAFLGWFASLVHGRMPRGFRDAIAYGIGYGAQTLAYLLLLTDRYPNADPIALLADIEPPPAHPISISVDDDLQRSRLTVFFRLLLAVPHLVWLLLWTIVAILASIVQWFATMITARPVDALHRFLSAYVRYTAHVTAYLHLVGNPFPGFTGAPGLYPIDVTLPAPEPQRRAVTFFRVFLAIPAWLVNAALQYALFAAAFLMWFAALVTARAPRGLRNLGAYSIRYTAQTNAYLYLVTDRYPHASPLEGRESILRPEEPELAGLG